MLNPKLRKAVLGLLKEKGTSYSPDIIANLSKEKKLKDVVGSICANTIYNALKSKIEGFKISDFPHKRAYYKKETVEERRKKKEISERKKEISIEVMPEDIKEKLVDTHFEGDTIIGKKEGGGNTLITLAHTKSQFTFIMRSKNKTAQATVDVIDKLNSKVKDLDKIMKTLLLDNGTEFSDWDGIMRSMGNAEEKRMQVYFAHAYCSYERGCNENKNRLVRRTFKKGKAVETLSDEAIMNIARDMNNMPRKALGYKTPLEVFEKILVAKNVDTSFLEEYRIENSKYLVA